MDEPNVFGNTALHIACYTGQEAVANELVNHGANVNQPNERGCSPLHFAAVSTNGALCLELLVNNGADVSMQVSGGTAALASYFFCLMLGYFFRLFLLRSACVRGVQTFYPQVTAVCSYKGLGLCR